MEKKVKNFFKPGSYAVNGSLWIEGNGIRFFGPGPVELLEHIERTGSINKAAKAMNMSYKKAWELVNRMNTQAETPFVLTSIGGEDGGGSTISEESKQMIHYYHRLRERFRAFMEKESNDF